MSRMRLLKDERFPGCLTFDFVNDNAWTNVWSNIRVFLSFYSKPKAKTIVITFQKHFLLLVTSI